jgi:hypothetical protein
MRPGPAALLLFLMFLASALWQFVLVDLCFIPHLLEAAEPCRAASPIQDTTLSALVLFAMIATVTFAVIRGSRSRSWMAVLGNAAVAIVLVRATWLSGRDALAGFSLSGQEPQIVLAAIAGATAGSLMAEGFARRAPGE